MECLAIEAEPPQFRPQYDGSRPREAGCSNSAAAPPLHRRRDECKTYAFLDGCNFDRYTHRSTGVRSLAHRSRSCLQRLAESVFSIDPRLWGCAVSHTLSIGMELDFRKDPTVLGTIVDELAIGVFSVDANGRFVAWSKGSVRITGHTEREIVGQPCTYLESVQCKGFAKLADFLKDTSTPRDQIANQECKIVAKDGRELFIHGAARRIYDDQAQIVGAVGAFADMTSFVEAHEKIAVLQRQLGRDEAFEKLIGESNPMKEVIRRLTLAADSDVSVYLTGESGTGKELAAAAIHAKSARNERPFLAVNCSAIPESLLESELFGHVKGAFTDAYQDKSGVFESANGGTLFLDEIGDISPAIQVKLLRVLQEREIRRVGDDKNRKIDVRLISASHRNLKELVEQGKIREDFYYRIHVFEIQMPPLRERKEDIPLLADHFIKQICHFQGKQVDGLSRDALQLMMEYHWPGNVRQLRNAIEHACVTVSGDRISYLDLPAELREPYESKATTADADLSVDERAERQGIVEALRTTGGNRTKAAELLGYSRVTLWKKITRFGIEVP